MSKSPLVSVVIPTYNRSHLITRAINSVLHQTYKNLECIVVDDASTDNTGELVHSINDDRIIYLRHDNNKYTSASRNTGIKNAKGKFIAFLDDDDVWLSTKLEKQVLLIQSLSKNFGMVYCWYDYFDQNEIIIREHHPKLRGDVFLHVLDQIGIGGCCSLLVRRDIFETIGGFDELLPRGNDGDFIRRVCNKYEVDFIPEVLVKVYSEHGSERISDNTKEGIKNAILAEEIKFVKFESELENYPKQKSNIYSLIGINYSKQRNWRLAKESYINALYLNPFNLLLFKRILSSLVIFFTSKKP